MISISNEFLEATFHEKGAELSSLKSKTSGIEYIWQADPEHWGRHAPVLFPIVGKLKNDTYRFEDKSYVLTQHGFARDRRFELINANQESVTFQLKWSEGSLTTYPFKFILEISYSLESTTLVTSYKIANDDDTDLYFSIGAHPAFNCPHLPGKNRNEYSLIFDQLEVAEKHLLESGLFNGNKKLVLENQQELLITDDLFDEDALVFKNLKSSKVKLNDGDQDILEFGFEGFPYLGIWSKTRKSPFVCIEPWFGLADSTVHDQNYISKEGVRKLSTGETFDCNYTVKILEG